MPAACSSADDFQVIGRTHALVLPIEKAVPAQDEGLRRRGFNRERRGAAAPTRLQSLPPRPAQSASCVRTWAWRWLFFAFLQRWSCAWSTVSVLLSWLGMTQGWCHSCPRRPPGLPIRCSGCSGPLRSPSASWVPLSGHLLSFPTIFLP